MTFELCSHAGGYPFQLVFGDDLEYVVEEIVPGGAGLYEVEIEVDWPETRNPRVRLDLMKPAFHGSLNLIGATISRVRENGLADAGSAEAA
ncbi:MAG: hypothetical protein ACRED9_03220 [Caulobacteraceae bacterium]